MLMGGEKANAVARNATSGLSGPHRGILGAGRDDGVHGLLWAVPLLPGPSGP